MPHPDLDAEQSYVDDAYRCLAAMRERTRRASEIADNAAQAVDSAIAHAHLAHRLGSLDDDVPGLSFGRPDGDGGDIAAGTSRGLRLLYVALTRAVQELVIVHARPLPPALVRESARWGTSPRWGARRRGT